MSREVISSFGVHREHFATLTDALEVEPQSVNRDAYNNHMTRSHLGVSATWFGQESFTNTAIAMREIGVFNVPEVLERVRTYTKSLKVAKTAINARMLGPRPRRVRARGDMGNELDANLARIGRHDIAWSKTVRTQAVTSSRRAVLYVGLQAASSYTAPALDWRQATALSIYERLTAAGYSVEVIIGSVVSKLFVGNNDEYQATYVAKPFQMPIISDKLAVMCSAAFYRTVVFASRYATARNTRLNSSLGKPVHGKVPDHVLEIERKGALLVQVPSDTMTQSAAQKAIDAAMVRLAAHLPTVA